MAPEPYWHERVVLVTGATSGIGTATVRCFADLGAHVVVHGRNRSRADEVVGSIQDSGGKASSVIGDLRDPAVCAGIVREAARVSGRLDVLVNNAGANVFAGTMDATLDDWDDCLAVDLRAVWLCSREAAAVMPAGSAIVNVSSNHANATLPGVFPYNVAKAGVNALTQSLAIELAPRGVRVVAIAPGYIDTPINDAYFGDFADPAAARAAAERLHPLGRLGAADEVAHAIAMLADGSRSGFTTGTVMLVDGGRSALLEDAPLTAVTRTQGAIS